MVLGGLCYSPQGQAHRTDTSPTRPSTGLFPISPPVATFGDPELDRLQETPPLSTKRTARRGSNDELSCRCLRGPLVRKQAELGTKGHVCVQQLESQRSAKHGHSV